MVHVMEGGSSGSLRQEAAARPARPRLLTVIPHLAAGGAERVVTNLLAAMRPQLFDYHLATLRPGNDREMPLPDHVRRWALHVPNVELSALPLALLLHKLRPDVVFSHIVGMNVMSATAVAASQTGARLVVVEHHVATTNVSPSGRPGLFHPLLTSAMRCTYPVADRIVGVSGTVLDETLRVCGASASKGIVISNPVVFGDLIERSKGPAGHPWLDGDGYEVVLGVGRLIEPKNFKLLIDAFARLAARRPNARLILAGDGVLRSELQAQVDRLGLRSVARLVGHWQNPYRAMRRARVVAVTSHTEGLSTVLIEAMALGTPVVAADFASARDTLPVGLEPAAHTPEAVASALEERIENAGDTNALKSHAAQFAVAPIARRYEELFADVLSERQRAVQ